ncbi:hypothetical protein Angca_002175, partial [Angiostrongylus cantonensis]
KDVKILSFGDVVLYASDLQTLLPGMWVNDNIISFACDYLLSKASDKIKEQVAIVSAASCELIRHYGEVEVVREIFDTLNFFSKEKVLFVLNDRTDPTTVGGSHWSLLVLNRKLSQFRYYDSMKASKEAVARQIVAILTPFLKSSVHHSFVAEDCAQQCNSFDCGMYVIEFVRRELEPTYASTHIRADSGYMNLQRQHWLDIINSLS